MLTANDMLWNAIDFPVQNAPFFNINWMSVMNAWSIWSFQREMLMEQTTPNFPLCQHIGAFPVFSVLHWTNVRMFPFTNFYRSFDDELNSVEANHSQTLCTWSANHVCPGIHRILPKEQLYQENQQRTAKLDSDRVELKKRGVSWVKEKIRGR